MFLMDEPLSNLDASLRLEMRAELKRLHRALKITTVYVTHDQAEALSLSDRIMVLRNGQVVDILQKSEATPYRITELASEVIDDPPES